MTRPGNCYCNWVFNCHSYNSPEGDRYIVSSAGASAQTDKIRRIHSEDLMLVVAAGYCANTVQTNAYVKYTTFRALVAACGGGEYGGCSGLVYQRFGEEKVHESARGSKPVCYCKSNCQSW